jgi:hypothetical protein
MFHFTNVPSEANFYPRTAKKKSDSRKKIEKSDYLNNHPTNYQEILYPKS